MRYLSEYEATQMMGIGHLGEVRQGPDGNLYQYVQGVDGLGNPIGFWRRFRKRLKKFVGRALPFAQQVASLIPHPAAQAAARGLTAVTPFLKQAGVAGYDGLGALYQAPDGTLYQMQGLAQDEELRGLGENDLTQMMGIGYLGEVRQAPDGNLYQWMQGVDGLGNPIGFWKKLKRYARYIPAVAAVRAAAPLLRRALPLAEKIAPLVPGGAAALTAATPILQQAGVAGYDGLGALYQAPDGTVYQVQGLAEDEELRGLAEDEELRGLDEDEELRGFAEDEELRGLEEDEELRGLDEDEELRGFAEDEELRGLDQGYVREGVSGLDAFVPERPATTRWFTPPNQPPEMWKPLW